ncbi:MAG TPA: glycosyltransferase family 4 protein [Gammaproteobacteria bacterium]|nr:glycosyltransferase family 4 protein [Gammaproteobacteria bacterium]
MSRIWLPYVSAKSGADVFVARLGRALSTAGYEPVVEAFEHRYQYAPHFLKGRCPPDVDLVLANSWNAFAFRRSGIPIVAYVLHCVSHRGYPGWKSRAQSIFHDEVVYRFERSSLKHADALVAISDSTRDEMIQEFGINSATVIPLWVDTARFSPQDEAIGHGGDRAKVLIVGNMSRRKGGDLIAPFCEALGSQFEVTVVAGLRGKAPSISARGARLRFVSGLSESELIKAYRAADIVACLSRHEGFGYTALEGMACSKPVVAFDVAGLRDVIRHGETGFLSPPENVLDMAERCRSLVNFAGLAHDFGIAGRERAINVFDEKQAVDAYINLFNGLGVSRR